MITTLHTSAIKTIISWCDWFKTLKTSPKYFPLHLQWQIPAPLGNLEIVAITVVSFLTTGASTRALVLACSLAFLGPSERLNAKRERQVKNFALGQLRISRFVHNRRYIISDIMHVNVVLILLNIWNMLVRRPCLCSVLLSEMSHIRWCRLPRLNVCGSSHQAGASFSHIRLKNPWRYSRGGEGVIIS